MFEPGPASSLESWLRSALTPPEPTTVGAIDVVQGMGTPILELVGEEPAPEEWERIAVEQQDLLVDLDRLLRRADAARTVALLDAYESAMRDLGHRKGGEFASRGSLGAQTFFHSIGFQLGMSPLRVAHLVDTAVLLRDALPRTWDAYLAGEATWRAVDTVVDQVHGLDAARWDAYDEVAADAAVTTPASRLKAALHRIRERLQDDTASARAERTRDRRGVVIDRGHDGAAALTITGPAVPIVGFDQALTKAAIAARLLPGETRSIGQLRHDIAIDLLVEGIKQSADPAWRDLKVPYRTGVVPSPVLTIPALAALGRTGEQAHLAGYGPIDLETAKELAGAATSFVRVLTDPMTGVRLDMDRTKRVPPVDMRRWVVLRDERCRFPGCNRPAELCDIDHVQEWQHAGVTAVGNLVSLSRPHHRAKSAALWHEELQQNGVVDWEDPWGTTFEDPPPTPSDPAPPDLIARSSADAPCPF